MNPLPSVVDFLWRFWLILRVHAIQAVCIIVDGAEAAHEVIEQVAFGFGALR